MQSTPGGLVQSRDKESLRWAIPDLLLETGEIGRGTNPGNLGKNGCSGRNNLLGYFWGAMDAVFSWRKTTASDLAECLKLHPPKNGAEIIGNRRAVPAWTQIFEMKHACRSALVELRCEGKLEIVGFGFASFVKKSFEGEVLNPTPGLNSRIIDSVVSGNSVTATYDKVRDANTCGDLEQVILDTSWKNGGLNAAQIGEVRVLLGRAYQELFSGYRFSRILWECVDELDLWHIHGHRGFRIVDRFEAYRLANPATTWNSDRALGMVNVETMRDDPYSIAAELFHHRHQPEFAFTRDEQELLEVALAGVDDASASNSPFRDCARHQTPLGEPRCTRRRYATGSLPSGRRRYERHPKAPACSCLREKSSARTPSFQLQQGAEEIEINVG